MSARAPQRPFVCCRAWTDFLKRSDRPSRLSGFVHELAHSRVPFTPTALAELADVPEAFAEAECRTALRYRKWLVRVGEDAPGAFVGILPKKR